MTVLQQIVKEAKRMRKLHPNKYAKWTDYVKAASKAIKKPGKKVAGTKAKPKPKPATRAKNEHKDIKSHNVNIRVVSGIDSNKFYINLLSKIVSEIKEKQALADIINKNYKDPKNKALRSYWASKRNAVNKNILMLKRQQNAIKKSIK